jgi:TonB-linked SusC/RagA family outer membrane protein
LQYTPIKGLMIEGFYARNATVDRDRNYLKNYNVFRPDLVSNTLLFDNAYPGVNSISESVVESVRNTYWLQSTYEFKLQDSHNFKVMGGFQGEDWESRGLGASRTNLPSDQPFINVGTQNQQNSGGINQFALAGFFARANYSYKDKFLIELNGRYDGSSRFSQAQNKQWGFFPSASAGWVVSEESFLKDSKVLSFAKIRASYGTLGNQNIPGGFYPFASNLSPNTNYYFNNVLTAGYALLTGGNPNVTWEQSTQADLGLDLEFFNGKLSITADIYQRQLSDMLINVPIPLYAGYNSPLRNAGSMQNTGWELSVKHANKIGDFRYDVTFLLSDVRNKVTDLRDQEFVSGLFISRVGEPLNSYYGYIADGLFQTADEVRTAPTHFPNTAPGDIRYRDVSGPQGTPDGVINQFDRVVLGNNFPRYDFGVNGNLSWKGFDLNFLLQGVGKRDNYMSGTGVWAFFASDFIASGYEYHKDRWTPSNPNASFPRLTDGIGNNQINSSYWMRNGAYMRLKNLQLGYTFPAKWLAKAKVEQLRLFVSGSNLFTISNFYKGFDPERNDNNGEFYPVMKTYTFGLNLRF